MNPSDPKSFNSEARLRLLLDDFANQLCPAVDGNFDFRIRIEDEDESLQKLQMLTNFVLDAASRAIREFERRNKEMISALDALRKAETHTRESETRLRAIFDSASDTIITIDEKGIIESANQTVTEVFGYEVEELIGQNIKMLMPSPYREEHNDYINRYLTTGKKRVIGVHREVLALRKDGTTFPADLGITEALFEKGRRFMGIVRDITSRKELETRLTQAQKLESIGQLASGIAHEINTPAQYLEGNISFLETAFTKVTIFLNKTSDLLRVLGEKNDPGDLIEQINQFENDSKLDYLRDEIPKAIEQSHEGIRRISEIVLAMKEFSHPGDAEKSLIDLNRLIENTITVSRNEWKYVAHVSTDLTPGLPPVPCLAGELSQVFLNVIVNAAHAISDVVDENGQELGKISISTSKDIDSVSIQITDTGPGIPDEIKSRIFDPFFTTKDVGRGTGQGLTIARSVVVDKHNGTIICDSKPGAGTTFTITLPLNDYSTTKEASE